MMEEKSGYIDRSGKMVIEPQFDNSGPFQEGFANVNTDGKWCYIDRTGNYMLRPEPRSE